MAQRLRGFDIVVTDKQRDIGIGIAAPGMTRSPGPELQAPPYIFQKIPSRGWLRGSGLQLTSIDQLDSVDGNVISSGFPVHKSFDGIEITWLE